MGRQAAQKQQENPIMFSIPVWGMVGTTDILTILPENAHLHAPSRETIGPAAKGDEVCWPYTKLPILHNRPHFMTKIPD